MGFELSLNKINAYAIKLRTKKYFLKDLICVIQTGTNGK